MPGFSHDFKQLVRLPSGGLTYNQNVKIGLVTTEVLALQLDSASVTSALEYIISIVDRYSELPVPIYDLYIKDLYYIWTNMLITDINLSDIFTEVDMCSKCKTINYINFSFNQVFIIMVNPFSNELTGKLEIKEDNFKIQFNYRQVKHNLDLSYLTYQLKNMLNEMSLSLAAFLSSQTNYLEYEGNEIPKNLYFDFYTSLPTNRLISIQAQVERFNNEFGMNNKLYYYCSNKECEAKNYTSFFNDFTETKILNNKSQKKLLQKKIEMYKHNLNFIQLGIADINDLSSIPLRDIEAYGEALSEVEVMPRGLF